METRNGQDPVQGDYELSVGRNGQGTFIVSSPCLAEHREGVQYLFVAQTDNF